MPDLDRDLAVLRDSLQDSVHQPEIGVVVARSRQRISRRRRQLGAAIAVLLIGAAVPLLRTPPEPTSTETPATPPATSPTAGPEGSAVRTPEGPQVTDIDFADDRHGYAIRHICTSASTPCAVNLLSTEDGQNWRVRSLPPDTGQRSRGPGSLWVLGPTQLAVGDADHDRDWWYSGDGGQSWQQISDTLEPAIDAIPKGARLDYVCRQGDTPDEFCLKTSLVVRLPGSGRPAPLASQPPLELMHPDRSPAAPDGSWWVTGLIPNTGRWAVAVSRDDGRTWSVGELPAYDGHPFISLQATPGYVLGVGQLPGTEQGLIAIFRSVDGGRTWEQTWKAEDGKDPRTIGGVAVAAADGRLIVDTTNQVPYASGDGGRTFAPIGPAGAGGAIRWTGAGYLARAAGAPFTRFRLSRDGLNWREFVVE